MQCDNFYHGYSVIEKDKNNVPGYPVKYKVHDMFFLYFYLIADNNMYFSTCVVAFGCPPLDPPEKAHLETNGQHAVIRCNETQEAWYLTCRGTEWVGRMDNCSLPTPPSEYTETTGQGRAGQGRAGQGRAGQGRAGQGRTGEDRTGQDRTGQDRTGQDRTGQETGQGRAGQGRAGQDRTGQDRTGQDRRQGRAGQDRTGQDRTGQDRTGQDMAGQDRTRHGSEEG